MAGRPGSIYYTGGQGGGAPGPSRSGYGPGQSFDVGYSPPSGPIGGNTAGGFGGGFSYGLNPGQMAASRGAYQRGEEAAQSALERLRAGRFAGSPFGQQLGGMFAAPPGYTPQALALQKTALAEKFAGSRESALQSLRARAAATGFGDSMGAIDAAARLRAGSAAGLAGAENQLFIENEMFRQRQREMAADAMARMYGYESEADRSYAMFQAQRRFDAIPGVTPPGYAPGGGRLPSGRPAAPGYTYLNERGEIELPPNATDWEKEEAIRERRRWVQEQGSGYYT